MVKKKKVKKINWKKIKWGSLTKWLKKHRAAIRRSVGDPFVVRGGKIVEINDNVLRKLVKNEALLRKLAGSHWKRIKRKILFKLNVLKG